MRHWFYNSNLIIKIGLGIWVIIGLGFFSVLNGRHMVQWNSYPELINKIQSSQTVPALTPANSNKLFLTHVLSQDCDCSKNLSEYLMSNERVLQGTEYIVFIESLDAKHSVQSFHLDKLKAKGFEVEMVSEDAIKDLPNFGTPMLLVSNAKREVVYSGGYTSHKILPKEKIYDLEILASLSGKGRTPSSLPIYGCSTQVKFNGLQFLKTQIKRTNQNKVDGA